MTWPGKFPIVRANAGSPIIFEPDVILGASLWKWHRLFPGDPALTLSGSNVTAWPCKASNGDFFQITASRKPLYSATSFNGGPGITGDGAAGVNADLLVATAPTPLVLGDRPYMWIVAQRLSAPAAFQTIGGLYTGTTTRLFVHRTAAGNWQFERRTNSDNVFTDWGPSNANPHLFESGFTVGGLDSHAVDAVEINSTATLAIAEGINFMTLFATETATFPANFVVAEVVVSKTDPTPLQKTRMRDYFGSIAYYGLVGL